MTDFDGRPAHQPLHALVSRQVRDRPHAIAVRSGVTEVTYARLAEWSDSIAARLLAVGVRPDDRVAVCVDRGTFPAAALAVLACGAAYVPIDAAYPEERQRFMLDDAAVGAIVCDDPASIPATSLPIVEPSVAQGNAAAQLPEVDGRSLAYLMYTSGSTGVPKGVLVEHQHVASLLLEDERLAIQPGDRVATFAPLAFDASTFEIWGALCRGGELVVLDPAEASTHEIGAQLRVARPNWLFLTSALFHLLVDHDPEAVDSVGVIITGGDVLSPKHVRAAAARGSAIVYAAYGPTEATVFTSLHRVDPKCEMSSVPIGRPLRGRPMYVLDAKRRPVCPGEVGELYIGGSGVARGYHARPGQTAQRFVPDALGSGQGDRLYASGDLGRMLDDGEFEFLGRVDNQVKIRGHRVEPGEVEAVLLGHPEVSEAAVVAIADGSGVKRLVANVSPANGTDLTVAEIREWLSERLPGHLVPASFVLLDSLPLNANGKTDRSALPYPWSRRDMIDGLPPFRQPETGTGILIAQVWAELLGLDRVGADDDFFQIGGDSLLSVRVLAALRERGVTISAMDFFRFPTVGELAVTREQTSGEDFMTLGEPSR